MSSFLLKYTQRYRNIDLCESVTYTCISQLRMNGPRSNNVVKAVSKLNAQILANPNTLPH